MPAVNEMHFVSQGFVLSRHTRQKMPRDILYNENAGDSNKKGLT